MNFKTGYCFAVLRSMSDSFRPTISSLLVSLFLLQHFFVVSPFILQAAPSAPLASTSIVISEVDGDTPLSGTDTANEWFELHNISNSPITLSNWTITDNAATDTIPTVTLGPGGHVIVAATSAGFASEHAGFTGTVLAIADGAIGSGLANGGDALILKDANGTTIDALSWGSNITVLNPAPLADTSTTTLQRNAAGTDTDTASDWTRAAQTPDGTTNSPNGTGQATPATVAAGNTTLLTVKVTPGTNPNSTNLAVTADLTLIGGSNAQTFFDNGTNGDATAGDNIFSYLATVGAGASPGTKNLPITITDAQMRSASASIALIVAHPPAVAQTVPFSQNWSNTGLIVNNDDWRSVPGIIGYRGDDLTTFTGADPQTILVDGAGTPFTVVANQTDPLLALSGGVAEFELANPTIALKGSGTADAPHLVINLDTTGQSNITVFYNVRDLDASSNNAVQSVALQYRIGNTGNYTNVPAAFIADASSPDQAGQVTSVAVALPAAVDNQPLVQLRIITANANGADEWIGIDDINISPNGTLPLTGSGSASPNQLTPGSSTLLTVAVNPATNPASDNITVTGDLTTIGGSSTQVFFDDGTNGDAAANDNIFSYSATIPANVPVGVKSLPISISDGQNRSASTSISLTVINAQSVAEHLVMGNPSGATTDVNQPTNYLMLKPQYSLSYHRDRGIPNWVSWHLDSTWIGSAQRQDDFRPDSSLPAGWYQVTQFDYSGSGFDRGHHTPSADRTRSIPDNSATFLMTNMMPQAAGNNQGPWEDLETYARTLLGQNELYIVAGGSGTGGTGLNGGVTNTIAGGKVTVPAFTWKVILVLPIGENDVSRVDANTRTIAVIMPNNHNIETHTWQQYIVSVDQVEALTGYNFFSEVPAQIQNIIEARIDGSNCSFSINPTSANASSSGSTGSVAVTAGAGCGWTATSNNPWITITNGATGSGNGTVNYTVAANTGAARNGSLTIGGQTFTVSQQGASGLSIGGRIAYGTNNNKFVPGVTLTAATGNPAQTVVATSTFSPPETAGSYLLQGLTDGGNYTVTPSKTTHVNGITAFDATLVLRCVAAGANCALTPNQQIAANTDGESGVSAFDATQILRFVAANGSNAETGQTGIWKFDLPSRTYNNLTTNQTGQDYTAFLIGDVDGDWAAPANLAEAETAAVEANQKQHSFVLKTN